MSQDELERRTLAEATVMDALRHLNLVVEDIDADLFATGVLDSLMLIELGLELEARFNTQISFDEIELETFRTVRSLAASFACTTSRSIP